MRRAIVVALTFLACRGEAGKRKVPSDAQGSSPTVATPTIQAMATLRDRPDIRLVILGRGIALAEIKEQASLFKVLGAYPKAIL